MRTFTALVALCVLFVSSHCWDKACRVDILDAVKSDIDADDVSKATEELTTAAKAAKFTEIYDNFLNYNSDFEDRVNQSKDSPAFAKAETNIGTAQLEKVLEITAIEDTRAVLKYYYVANCCYYFNPCLSVKIGYHAIVTVPNSEVDPVALKQSFVAAWRPALVAVVQAKNIL